MGPFAALERFFERLFERPTARLFRTRLQPLQLQRRIERTIESSRLNSADRTFIPNRFVVRLHPVDFDAFGELVTNLESELAGSALAYARAHHYTLADRPDVRLRADPSVSAGDVHVQARFVDDDGVRDAGAAGRGRQRLRGPPQRADVRWAAADDPRRRTRRVPGPRPGADDPHDGLPGPAARQPRSRSCASSGPTAPSARSRSTDGR